MRQALRLIIALLLPPLIATAQAAIDRRVVMPWIVDAVIAVAPIVIGAVIILKMPWGPFLKACAAVAYAAIMVSMIVVVGLTNAFP